jgi:ElaB/YqjD/DUF883 family membrane-anchored ribosome-binding protein
MQQPHTQNTSTELSEMTSRAEGTVQEARKQLDQMLERLNVRMREAARYADREVQNKPWTAVGLGFGVGVLVGALAILATSGRR